MYSRKKIAVIGGGISGIRAALRLAESGRYAVTLFEQADRLGGLSTWFTAGQVTWDKYYHVILSTDQQTLAFLEELGLTDQIFWREARSGFYGDKKLVPMSTATDFLRFPFMSFWQKMRMGLGILFASRWGNPSRLDRIFARQWLTRIFGRRVYENIWEPLLRSKLGEAREKTSALFIWATIRRLYGTRQGKEKKEKMGHVHGGYRAILEAAERKLAARNIDVHLSEAVSAVSTSSPPYTLNTATGSYSFDQILFTIDCPSISSILQAPSGPYWQNFASIGYLSIVCVVVLLRRPLSPYYVINLLDKKLPFTGIIEATNIVAPAEVQAHIVFLPKYLPAGDPLYHSPDSDLTAAFLHGLHEVFPDLDDQDIIATLVHRAPYVQPVQTLGYQEQIPDFATPFPGIYVVNTAMIINSTLNNDTSLRLADGCVQRILADGQ